MQGAGILLVNPSNKRQMYGKLADSLAGIEPPLWTGLLAGFIREKGFSVRVIDADAEEWTPEHTAQKIIEQNPFVIGIGAIGANPSASSTPKMDAVSKILHILKDKGVKSKTFLYGIHPSALPERTLREEPVDFICKGECFYTVWDLLNTLKKKSGDADYSGINGLWYRKNNQIIGNGWGGMVQNLDELPFVAWNLLPMAKYKAHNWHCFGNIKERGRYAAVYTSLGCPYDCKYCNIHALYDGRPRIRYRSPEKVLEEIDLLVDKYNITNLKILDELFVLKIERAFEICDLLIRRNYGLNIWAYARVDTVNEKILRIMKQAGINWLCYGIEAGNKDVRAGVSKGRFGKDVIKKAIKLTHENGIHVIGNFMFGLPDDNMETMQETFKTAQELKCEYVNFYTTMAYPGSQLYSDALKNNTRLPLSWIGYSQLSAETLPLSTKYISAEDVLRFRDNAFVEYYSNPAYLRMIEDKFGSEAAEHIDAMLAHKIERNLLKKECEVKDIL